MSAAIKLQLDQEQHQKRLGNKKKVALSPTWWEDKTHILLDMDGTLIKQPGQIFNQLFALAAFFRLRKAGSVKSIIKAIHKTKNTLLDGHSFPSNQEAFFQTLSDELKVEKKHLEDFVNTFFSSDYPYICLFLNSEPYARKLIDLLQSRKRHITLATNSVFGCKEIELRLKASSLYLHDFDLVTSWDVMKSAKPQINFFKETLKKIGATPENTVMIGNDPFYDLPAHKLGIHTLLVGKRLTIKDIADSLENSEMT